MEDKITTEIVVGIIRDRGPISLSGIRDFLIDGGFCSSIDFALSEHCSVCGILSSMVRGHKIRYLLNGRNCKEFIAP